MSVVALRLSPSLFDELRALSARITAAWTRPPKTSVPEIAAQLADVLGAIEASTASLVKAEAATRASVVTLDSMVDPDFEGDLPAKWVAEVVAEAEAMLPSLPLGLAEEPPMAHVIKNVAEPFNDALRNYRRAVQDYAAAWRRILALVEARDAADIRAARAALGDGTDDIVPWTSARADLAR